MEDLKGRSASNSRRVRRVALAQLVHDRRIIVPVDESDCFTFQDLRHHLKKGFKMKDLPVEICLHRLSEPHIPRALAAERWPNILAELTDRPAYLTVHFPLGKKVTVRFMSSALKDQEFPVDGTMSQWRVFEQAVKQYALEYTHGAMDVRDAQTRLWIPTWSPTLGRMKGVRAEEDMLSGRLTPAKLKYPDLYVDFVYRPEGVGL